VVKIHGTILKSLIKKDYNKLLEYTRYQLAELTHIDAEDVLHEVAFNVYKKIDFETAIQNVAAYVYRSIKNKVTDIIRKPRNTVSLDSLDEKGYSNSHPDSLISKDESVDKRLEREEMYDYLHRALNSLPSDYQNIIVATEFEEKTLQELSLEWNIPLGTLLSRRHRALAKLYKILEKHIIQ
jgi:RNA polymerase sigma-70 factor (ECF subfamily)